MSKSNLVTFTTIILMVLTSACNKTFYQMYETTSEDVNERENYFVYENDDLKISYDLWGENGELRFLIENKTEKNLYINKRESFFIVNGIAKDYFQNLTVSRSTSTSASIQSSLISTNSTLYMQGSSSGQMGLTNLESFVGGQFSASGQAAGSFESNTSSSKTKESVSKGFSVVYQEKEIITIPPGSGKLFSKFEINGNLYRDCGLLKYPRDKKSESFNKEESPLTFENRLKYYKQKDLEQGTKIENEFWVSEISNYPYNEFVEDYKPKFCGDKATESKKRFIHKDGKNFYIEYKKSSEDPFDH